MAGAVPNYGNDRYRYLDIEDVFFQYTTATFAAKITYPDFVSQILNQHAQSDEAWPREPR